MSLFSGRRSTRRRTTSSCATRATPSRSRSAGGQAMPATRTRRSSPTRIPRPTGSRRHAVAARRRGGMQRSASTSSTGTTSGPPGPARGCARLRPLGNSARLHGVRLGSRPVGQRRGRPAARRLIRAFSLALCTVLASCLVSGYAFHEYPDAVAASHRCVRTTRDDMTSLYDNTPVGRSSPCWSVPVRGTRFVTSSRPRPRFGFRRRAAVPRRAGRRGTAPPSPSGADS